MISVEVLDPDGVFKSPMTLLVIVVIPELTLIPNTELPALDPVRLAILFLLTLIPVPPVRNNPLKFEAPVVVKAVIELL